MAYCVDKILGAGRRRARISARRGARSESGGRRMHPTVLGAPCTCRRRGSMSRSGAARQRHDAVPRNRISPPPGRFGVTACKGRIRRRMCSSRIAWRGTHAGAVICQCGEAAVGVFHCRLPSGTSPWALVSWPDRSIVIATATTLTQARASAEDVQHIGQPCGQPIVVDTQTTSTHISLHRPSMAAGLRAADEVAKRWPSAPSTARGRGVRYGATRRRGLTVRSPRCAQQSIGSPPTSRFGDRMAVTIRAVDTSTT